jgi:hypothetical protein
MEQKMMGVPSGMVKSAFSLACETFARHSNTAVCFSIGEVLDLSGLQIIPELTRLPYPVCWFQGQDTNSPWSASTGPLFGVLAIENSGGWESIGFVRFPGGAWEMLGHAESFWSFDPGLPQSDQLTALRFITRQICMFLSALNCQNVKRHEHLPDPKLQKSRKLRGKIPLFSYWTLHLNGRSEQGDCHGGTHASPRVHLRRGHPRQYAPGKWTWVQPCAVGNKHLGMVHKDYALSPVLGCPPTQERSHAGR